jgi:hypothetical protein
MFQVANTQFLHIAIRQKQYAHMGSLSDQEHLRPEKVGSRASGRWKKVFSGMNGAGRIDMMIIYIGLGLVVQVGSLSPQSTLG